MTNKDHAEMRLRMKNAPLNRARLGPLVKPSADGRSTFREDGGSPAKARIAAQKTDLGRPRKVERVVKEADADRPVTSPEMLPVYFPRVLHLSLGDYTEERGRPIPNNQCHCAVIEAAWAANDIRWILESHKVNGKALAFTGSGLNISIAGRRASYVIKDEDALLDLWRFDHGMPMIFDRAKRRVQAFYRGDVPIMKATEARKGDIRHNTALLNAARKAAAPRTRELIASGLTDEEVRTQLRAEGLAEPARKRDRLASLERCLRNAGKIT